MMSSSTETLVNDPETPLTTEIPIGKLLRQSRHHPVDQVLQDITKDTQQPQLRSKVDPAPCDTNQVWEKVSRRAPAAIKFPVFDAADPYVPDTEVLSILWEDETNRLMSIAHNPKEPLEFSSNGFFEADTEEGYRRISQLSQTILTALAICQLDTECTYMEHCPRLTTQERIERLINSLSNVQDTTVALDAVKGFEAQDRATDAAFSLLSYISAVLTRLLIQTSPGLDWQTNVLAVLIRRITKIKVLLLDLSTNSTIALQLTRETLLKARASNHLQHLEARKEEGIASAEEITVDAHCAEQSHFLGGLNTAIRQILMSMRFVDNSGLPETTFDISAVVYKTGFENFEALLFQDKDLEYSATSNLHNMNTAHSAFNILNQTVTSIDSRYKLQFSTGKATDSLGTELQWAYRALENKDRSSIDVRRTISIHSMSLQSMDGIISTMVPLATTCPVFLSSFTKLQQVMSPRSVIQDDAKSFEGGKSSAFFRLHTNHSKEKQGVLRLSEAWSSGYFSRSSLVRGSGIRPETQQNALRQFERSKKHMKEWVVEDTCITVPCPAYVWTVIAMATLFAVGGLGMEFSNGQRINGVDPSNLTTYSWVVAVFIVLVGKSLRVNEWPWNDFLRARLRCRSVSELHSVTGIDAQLIIAKLIHDEQQGSVLRVRGPYNSAFRKRSTDGFSIDRPISLSTLLLSGMTMLKVVGAKGEALICLDFRNGTDLAVISHSSNSKKGYLLSERTGRPSHGISGNGEKVQTSTKCVFSRSQEMDWTRIQGVYNARDVWFG